jgi:hypothetical protein
VRERGAQEEQGKTGANRNERLGQRRGSGGTSVQLSQDQRTRIQAVIGKESRRGFSGSTSTSLSAREFREMFTLRYSPKTS